MYIMGQATVPTASTVALFTVPPSLCNVTFWSVSAVPVYIGTSTAVTTANGLVCHSIPTSFMTYIGSKGAVFYGVNTNATTVASVQFILVTDQ